MTNGLIVAPNERQVLRVFALDLAPEAVAALRDGAGQAQALGALVGLDRLAPAHVQIVDTADLAGVGLAQFLVEGDGAMEAQVAADRARLDALEGAVMIVTSAAFDAAGATLHPGAGARLVGTYREDVAPVQFEPLPDAGARGVLTPPTPAAATPPAGMGRGMYIALAVLLAVVVLALAGMLSR